MATWDNSQYDQNATQIASTFCAGQGQNGANLTDLVEKVARDNSLNGEQIRRLARTANVKTFGAKFEEMKTAGAEDRNVEFQLADENEVLRRLAGTAEAAVKVAYTAPREDQFPDLPDAYADIRRPVPLEEKTAGSLDIAMPKVSAHKEIMRLQRLHEEADMRAKQASTTWHYGLEGIMQMQKKANWTPTDTFNLEKTALALYAVSVLPEINILRRAAGTPELSDVTNEKVAALRDRVVVTETPAVQFIKRAMDARNEWVEYDGAKQLIEKRLGYWRSKIASDKKPEKKNHTLATNVGYAVGIHARPPVALARLLAPGTNVSLKVESDNPAITQFMSGASDAATSGYEKKK